MPAPARPDVPPPLVVASSLTALQGVVLLGLAVLALSSLAADRVVVAVAVAVFFAAAATLLLTAAWSLARGSGWGRGPVLIAQLIQLGLAWTNRSTLPVVLTATLVVGAVVVVLGVVHPASVERLSRERQDP